tara:strand:+ start:17198 stop:17395 length:198 start_codon:yes stop_codon:yes gene_type:complete
MKTAMQEFIDNVIPMHVIELPIIKQEIKKALEKEKEQICDSYVEGLEGLYMGAEEYYNKTFNQNK